jgi:hypothetical protein
MGKKNNSYTASYKLKVISFAEQFGNRAAEREFGILESNVRYWREQKEDQDLHKKNPHILRTPLLQRPNWKKKYANYASKYGIYVFLACATCSVYLILLSALILYMVSFCLQGSFSRDKWSWRERIDHFHPVPRL